ncbi:MAG: LysR family transcriptional regulator [Xanthomonadales bacterium]|nr:LysR family transcriptional regulator [Xanthomonadales bacterium]
MRLRQIEVFHAVYSSGSITGAAALLHVSQPSVSKVLAHAEQQLGYRLFDRIKGKLVATPEAHRLFGHVSSVYKNVDELRRVARNLRASDSGTVRIAATPAFGTDLLPTTVARYLERHPDTVFELETLHHNAIQRGLLQSRIDIGLCFDPDEAPGIAVEPLARAQFVVLAPPGTRFPRKRVRLKDLASQPFIALHSRGPLGRILTTHLESGNADLNIVAVSETYHVARGLVARGAGVTIVDAVTAASSGPDVGIWPLNPGLAFDICALHFADAPLSVVSRRFLDTLGEDVREFVSDYVG